MAKSKSKFGACVMDGEVIRKIRQHARSHMRTEVCGVLIGDNREGAINVDECIPGLNASQAGSHVTFTQDTWAHVYKVKDKEFPEARIVGWYHSHPGFGVFLSEHDTFIHKNFFSSPYQIAWVYDPHSDEEGCFGWVEGHIERIASIKIFDRKGGELADPSRKHEPPMLDPAEDEESLLGTQRSGSPDSSLWARWTITLLTHVLALGIGLFVAWYIFPRLLVIGVPVDPQTGRSMTESAPARPGTNGGQADQPPPTNSANQGEPIQAPLAPKLDGAKGNDAPSR